MVFAALDQSCSPVPPIPGSQDHHWQQADPDNPQERHHAWPHTHVELQGILAIARAPNVGLPDLQTAPKWGTSRCFRDNCNHYVTTLSEEREVHCRLASMILLLFVLVCIALVLQEWQEFQVEVTGSRKLILTVDLKHRGEPVGETLDPAAACSTSNPTHPESLRCFRCWESHTDFGNFFTCPAGSAQQAMHGLPEEMPQIGWDLLQWHLRQKQRFQNIVASPPTMQWTWLSEACLDPSYSSPMDDAMVGLAQRCC